MGIMSGKKGVIFGVSNKHGIAYGIAEQLFCRYSRAGRGYFMNESSLTDMRKENPFFRVLTPSSGAA